MSSMMNLFWGHICDTVDARIRPSILDLFPRFDDRFFTKGGIKQAQNRCLMTGISAPGFR